jgi:hypothetical protein
MPHFGSSRTSQGVIDPLCRPIFRKLPASPLQGPRQCPGMGIYHPRATRSCWPRPPHTTHTHRRPLETNVQSWKHPHRCSPSFARGITSGKGRLPAESASDVLIGGALCKAAVTTDACAHPPLASIPREMIEWLGQRTHIEDCLDR